MTLDLEFSRQVSTKTTYLRQDHVVPMPWVPVPST